MTHEFKKIIEACLKNQEENLKSVLATVVALDGSSYRKPGVRMLIAENGKMTGAVSGGCVEKEVLNQAQNVFKNGCSKVMTYDGRYRLGCEGILYILLEPFSVSEELQTLLEKTFRERQRFFIASAFRKEECQTAGMGSAIKFDDGKQVGFSENTSAEKTEELSVFKQEMKPLFRMLIIGAEHDAVQLCSAASLLGWEVLVNASPKDPRTKANFPGAQQVLHLMPEEIQQLEIDSETSVMLMNHSYATDLKFLLALKDSKAVYIGLLGAAKRREKIFNAFIEYHPEIDADFLDKIYGPAGLDIGAETPQEISVSVLSEILTVTRGKQAFSLREKIGKIHT
ncbi:XdhC family protein [Zunongwangia sp. F363]|uniref:XdhC family protein n=1 Tax=Autumnicola tepida TaxID=3075595 RepID=A0ABU3C8X8_9FLAO|nr:XdhC family protein [Zunongwangia sp. F363]MDT0642672.1 XdhC family protein [Zunongwangia sp. F363]